MKIASCFFKNRLYTICDKGRYRMILQSTRTRTRDLSSSKKQQPNEQQHTNELQRQQYQQEHPPSPLAKSVQTIIQTRRTTSYFAAPGGDTTEQYSSSFWNAAMDRAVECGRRAPNHKKTEAFFFRRMISPSSATEELANIAYQVTFHKKLDTSSAEKKREKWQSIPAFLVAMVRSSSKQDLYPPTTTIDDNMKNDETTLYDPLPFVPAPTERDMEDYAATCAAIENILLSLHAEEIATKWATGPVIQTPAFRQLVGASSKDRIVGLIMMGMPQPAAQARMKPRRFRQSWEDFSRDVRLD